MTAGIVLAIVAMAALGSITPVGGRRVTSSPRSVLYLSQIIQIWMLLAATVATIYIRRAFISRTLRHNARPWRTEFLRGLAILVAFLVAVGLFSTLFQAGVHHSPAFGTIDRAIDHINDRLNLTRSMLGRLLPITPVDLLLWTVVSLSAAFCEELIFRGYLLHQAIAALKRTGLATRPALILSVLFTGVLFGAVHIYQGIGSALIISFLGIFYGAIALRLGNLRALIVAHFLQDFLAGLFAFSSNLMHH